MSPSSQLVAVKMTTRKRVRATEMTRTLSQQHNPKPAKVFDIRLGEELRKSDESGQTRNIPDDIITIGDEEIRKMRPKWAKTQIKRSNTVMDGGFMMPNSLPLILILYGKTCTWSWGLIEGPSSSSSLLWFDQHQQNRC
jgi:hypothetical protein